MRISIHAPARGATRLELLSLPADADISIHAPARGATDMSELRHAALEIVISIHAPARGATDLA